jgi:spore germination protein PE
VKDVRLLGVDSASTLLVGDLVTFKPKAKAIAVQREVPFYLGREGDFDVYRAFTRPIPQLISNDEVVMELEQSVPQITVGHISVVSVTTSSLLQIGSVKHIEGENRLMHIRQLLKGRRPV